jgi:endothelin-converting enzyme/putative endopeptidase
MPLLQIAFYLAAALAAMAAQSQSDAARESAAAEREARGKPVAKPAADPASSVTSEPRSKVPLGFDVTALNTNADPCVDFYEYACGAWRANNPIPPDRSRWGRFDVLAEHNLVILRDILEHAARDDPGRSAVEQKIGDYYAACMDEAAINKKGIEPVKLELERIAALTDKNALADTIARLHGIGANAFFNFSSGQDFKNSNEVIAQADQGGLGLPDRDYYLKNDPKTAETRRQYVEHVQNIFELLGYPADKAAAQAQVVLNIETALAKGSLDAVSRRDPAKVYHKVHLQELAGSLNPSFSWARYLSEVKAPPIETLNVAVPDFFKNLDSLINDTSLDDLKTYLTWHVVRSQAPLLSAPFVDENFNFYGRILTGAKELRPRWKRCVSFVDSDLGEALGKKYVERTFGAEGKERTLKMVRAIENTLARDIKELTWMTPETKERALEKLRAITNKIGYPDQWRDYSDLKIIRGDALGNSKRASQFEFHRQLQKIGKPPDRAEWEMTPPTVNAYYDPQMNNINFPAGILQPPFFDRNMDDAVNFGAIGAVIGHELTHGFDDQGRKFDPKGNLRDWWTAKDAEEFEKRADCLVDEYSNFTAVDDVKLSGKLTLGENTADSGGVRLAFMALMDDIAGRSIPEIDGFTPEQRLFLGFAQVWCENVTDEAARLSALTNPHSLGRHRVNGVLQNLPEFQKAFSCQVGQPMVRKSPCRVW